MGNKETKIKGSCPKFAKRSYISRNESLGIQKVEFLDHKTNGYTLSQASSDKKPGTKKR